MNKFIFLFLMLVTPNALADTVIQRDGGTPIPCEIVSWSKEGLRISTNNLSSSNVLPWYKIKEISTEEIGVGFLSHLARGEMLWRAKLRLLRGDIALAAPLFKEVFMQLKNSAGDDAYLAAEGLLRCNLAMGKLNTSVAPWLAVVDHIQDQRNSQLQVLASVIDSETLLCPHLPPVWDAILVQKSLKNLALRSDVALAFYNVITSTTDSNIQDLTGPAFLNKIIEIMESKQPVSIPLDELQKWQKCWFLFAEATGLLKGGDEDNAMLRFAEVAALYQASQPWLAGASMVALSKSFNRTGNVKVADNIKNEISRVLPSHPLRKE